MVFFQEVSETATLRRTPLVYRKTNPNGPQLDQVRSVQTSHY